MLRPSIIVAGAALILTGCRAGDESQHIGQRIGLTDVANAASITAPMAAALGKKTFSDRVLTAIALERVTGRKPDPRRLMDLD